MRLHQSPALPLRLGLLAAAGLAVLLLVGCQPPPLTTANKPAPSKPAPPPAPPAPPVQPEPSSPNPPPAPDASSAEAQILDLAMRQLDARLKNNSDQAERFKRERTSIYTQKEMKP